MEGPCERAHPKHSIYCDPGDGHIQWVNLMVIIKPILYNLYMKHVSGLTLGVPLGISRGKWIIHLSRVNRLYSGFYLVHQANCSLKSNPQYISIICHL